MAEEKKDTKLPNVYFPDPDCDPETKKLAVKVLSAYIDKEDEKSY